MSNRKNWQHLNNTELFWFFFQLTNIFPQLRSFGYFCGGPIWKQLFWKCQCLLLLSNKRWHHNIFRMKASNILSVLFMSNMFEYYYNVLAIITYPLCHVFLYFWNKYCDGSPFIIFFLILAMTKQDLSQTSLILRLPKSWSKLIPPFISKC